MNEIQQYYFSLLGSADVSEIELEKAKQFFMVFFQEHPMECAFLIHTDGKAYWHNQAQIVVAQEDCVLEQYVVKLLEWQMDPNWPGADLIYDRLVIMKGNLIDESIESMKKVARQNNKKMWLSVLNSLSEDRKRL